MEEIQLESVVRKQRGKSGAKALRRTNFIPAVVYGKKINYSISINKTKFQRAIGRHSAENVIFSLKILDEASGGKKAKEHPVIVKDIQYDPLIGSILHLDFHEISLTQEITVTVPIVAKGEPVGVKQDDGSLEHQLWELEVKCLPKNLPEKIEVDVSLLNIGDNIHIRDLQLPAGVVALQDADTVVLSIAAPIKAEEVTAEEAEAVAEEGAQEPEVIKEKKEKEGGEATEEPESKEKDKEKSKE